MNLENIFSFENLYDAHIKCRRSKQHKGEIIRFEVNISENIYNELEALRKIRNMCAHRIKIITPDDPRIIEYEKKLRLVRDVFKGIEKNKQLSIFIMSIACYIVAIVKRITVQLHLKNAHMN